MSFRTNLEALKQILESPNNLGESFSPKFAGLNIYGTFVTSGSLVQLASNTVEVKARKIDLGMETTPSDANANGGGIVLHGTTNHSFTWNNATKAWTSTEDIDLAANKRFLVGGQPILNFDSLGTQIINSNLQKLGTVNTGVWQATPIGVPYGGTGRTEISEFSILRGNGTNGFIEINATASDANKYLKFTGTGFIYDTISNEVLNTATVKLHTGAGNPTIDLATDRVIIINKLVPGVTTVTLPTTGVPLGRMFTIKDARGDASINNITIACQGVGVRIDGDFTQVISSDYESISVIWNGSSYNII